MRGQGGAGALPALPKGEGSGGVYTSLEVREAIQLGYRVGYTWEVCHFPQRSSTLLREFIYSLFLDKEYCSGWPGWVKTPEDQEAHIKQLEDWYGQEVDPTKFKKNSAGRQLAKLILNSCWGYFAKREDMSSTEFLVGGQCTRLLVLDKDATTVLQSVEIVGPGLMVKWKPKEEWGPTLESILYFEPTGEPDAPFDSYKEHL